MRGNNARGMLQFLNSRELIGLMSLNLDRVVPMGATSLTCLWSLSSLVASRQQILSSTQSIVVDHRNLQSVWQSESPRSMVSDSHKHPTPHDVAAVLLPSRNAWRNTRKETQLSKGQSRCCVCVVLEIMSLSYTSRPPLHLHWYSVRVQSPPRMVPKYGRTCLILIGSM